MADLDALLALDDIDCIVIATPNDTHFDLARRTLEAGKHVVVDKPVTLNAADAHTLANIALARSNCCSRPFTTGAGTAIF